MKERKTKLRLKGNESFNFREGWLRKGMRCVIEDPTLFSKDDVMERLGVGSKMVRSIKFWLQAANLCEERYINKGRGRAFYLTEDFGRIIEKYDKYFDDAFTLCLLHYHIVSNEELCVVWNIFFNDFKASEFTREEAVLFCESQFQKRLSEGTTYSKKSFDDDCSSVLRMYSRGSNGEDIEADLSCPLSELGLLQKNSDKHSFTKQAPTSDKLNMYAVLYVILRNLEDNIQANSSPPSRPPRRS